MWQGGGFPLESSWDNSMERRKKEGKNEKKEKEGEKKKRGVRSSTFSLGFTEIGSLVSVGARRKVCLRYKSFAWVQESGVFAKLREVGIFLLLWLLLV